jgi:hypothetical protein
VIDALAADGTRFSHSVLAGLVDAPVVRRRSSRRSIRPSHRAIHKSDALPDAVVTLAEDDAGRRLRDRRLRQQHQRGAALRLPAGLRPVRLPRAEFFFGATESAAQLTIYNQLRLIRERFISKKKWVENYYQPADVVSKHGLDWLAGATRSAVLHVPALHGAARPVLRAPYNGEAYARVANPNPDPSLADKYRDAYDGAIRFLDAELGKLFAELKAKGVYEDSLILSHRRPRRGVPRARWLVARHDALRRAARGPADREAPRGGAKGVVNDAMVSSVDVARRSSPRRASPCRRRWSESRSRSVPMPRRRAIIRSPESELEGNSCRRTGAAA